MWPFKRKETTTSNLPPEVQDYYQAERRQRVGVAWLLGAGALLVTIALAIGIFFGGRWAYRKFTHKNNGPVATPVQSQPKPLPAPTSQPKTPASSGSTPSSPTNTAPSSGATTAPASPSPTTPSTSGVSSAMPNTGPGDTLGIFAGTSLGSAVLYQAAQRRRLRREV